ncbi:MAG: DUF6537 domain-containing protein, partial [Rhodospirillales bacterium]
CAAEKRRRRKRGRYPDPAARPFINAAVCEGCGDCGEVSNCVAIQPLETELGRKRAIDQSACNKDFSCLKGFCPSFVTVYGAVPRKPEGIGAVPFPAPPAPKAASAREPYGIVVTGIGGTGVVTIGAVLAMAAHLEGKGVSVLDVAGLAQKNGAVFSHIRIADDPDTLHAVRIAAGGARLLIGCDMVTAAGAETLGKLRADHTRAIVNAHRTMTADFTHRPDLAFPDEGLRSVLVDATGAGADFVDATGLALALLGDSIAANMFMVGFAYQKGLLPLTAEAIGRAIELNGVAVEFNQQAFLWGRRAAFDPGAVARVARPVPAEEAPSVDEFVTRRVADLTAYQNAAYARRYADMIGKARAAEAARAKGMTGLVDAVARAYFKLLAHKDEYEVARLYTDGAFARELALRFQGKARLGFHLAPPLFAKRDPATGHLKKREYGPWVMSAFRVVAALKGLRGTPFDVFGYAAERKMERQLIAEYEAVLAQILAGLSPDNHVLAVEIAALPLQIRGFGHVKERNRLAVKDCETKLLTRFRGPGVSADAAV